MNGFKTEARHLVLIKNVMSVCLGCILALSATGTYAGCFGSANEKRCQDVQNASKQAQKEGEARRQEYVKNGGTLHDTTTPTKVSTTTSK
ncbi:hypothetical protein LMG19083_02853 [Ralstonia psammae]|uniref:Lipoprotein n=1 Tax=Ralstonia psammae TaxID=3058598 RepID=A0ABM9JJZ9_9RALS|nr:hypothetical protein [Ralstonia sp. LMG 19083]CAJ0796346.1 hypothetical protein LMG19083_02853 [Ralstonia sp. LMG 19083]